MVTTPTKGLTTPDQRKTDMNLHENDSLTHTQRQEDIELGYRAISGRKHKHPDDIPNKINQRAAQRQEAMAALSPSERGALFITEPDLTYHSEVTVHANSVVVRKISHQKQQPAPRAHRGAITRFTARSRSRMLRKTGMLRQLKNPYFVTLTYPGYFDHSPDRVKAHLFALKKRIKRRFPQMAMIWRMELKRRKTGASVGEIVPHFHLLLWGMQIFEADMLKAMKHLWFEVAQSYPDHPAPIMPTIDDKSTPDLDAMTTDQRNFYEHGVDVEQLFNFRHTLSYVSKYAAKEEDDESGSYWGRRWGICGRVDLSASYTVKLTLKQHYALRRAVRKWLEHRGSRYAWWLSQAYPDYGFSALGFGDDDDTITACLTDILRLIACIKDWEIDVRIIDVRKRS